MKTKPNGEHWRGLKGYRVIEEIDEYNHYFGGRGCEVPICIGRENVGRKGLKSNSG